MKKAILAVAVVTAVSACSSKHGVHWGYEGNEGPDKWSSLSADYHLCAAGKSQSPVDISNAMQGDLKPIEFNYKAASGATVVNNGHTIQVNYPAGSYAVISDKRYDLLQFHFHVPSEHTINGDAADMVAHLVHKAQDGQLAVVGVLFEQGAANETLAPVWQSMPASSGKATLNETLDVASLLPSDTSHFNYSGSLTTPPCSEGVNWNVLKQPVSVSNGQVAAFTRIFPKSVRPVQPLNGRALSSL